MAILVNPTNPEPMDTGNSEATQNRRLNVGAVSLVAFIPRVFEEKVS